MELKEQILNYVPFNEQEKTDKELLLEWLSEPKVFERENQRHISPLLPGLLIRKERRC